MFEHLSRKKEMIVGTLVGTLALTGCSIDSYLTDPSNVQCDGRRTEADLPRDGVATFIVHGRAQGELATIKVRRHDSSVSVNVTGDVTGPPQELQSDGFTKPVRIVEGSELSAFGAGGDWVIDARRDVVVIQGSCDGK